MGHLSMRALHEGSLEGMVPLLGTMKVMLMRLGKCYDL